MTSLSKRGQKQGPTVSFSLIGSAVFLKLKDYFLIIFIELFIILCENLYSYMGGVILIAAIRLGMIR